MGDFRLPSIEVERPDGSLVTDLRLTDWAEERGKYAMEGLPAFRGREGEARTLHLYLEDPPTGLVVRLSYGVFEDCDLITRAVAVYNQGEAPVRLRRCASLCLDFQGGDFDLLTFDGCHTRERGLSRAPLRPGVQSVESIRGMSSHHHNPFVVLCEPNADEDHGVCYGAALVYSGECLRGDVLMHAGWPLPQPCGDYQAIQLYLEAATD